MYWGPPRSAKCLRTWLQIEIEAKKANKHIGQEMQAFVMKTPKVSPPRKSQPCPSSSSVGFIPRTQAFSPKSIWLGKVCEDRVDGGHDLLNFGTTGDRAKNPPGNLKEDIISIIRTLIERYHIMIIMFYLLVSTNYP